MLGPHDPLLSLQRDDPFFYDGAGSPFAILETILPGFGVFRYPCKLFTLVAVALAVLAGAEAGIGWSPGEPDAGGFALLQAWAGLLGASVLGLASSSSAAAALDIVATFDRPGARQIPSFGPAYPRRLEAATAERLFRHGAIVFAAGLALAHATPRRRPRRARRRPGPAGLLTGDLALANAGLIWTVPQAEFEAPPEVARRIAAAERTDPSPAPGLFRIYRMPDWLPPRFVLNLFPGASEAGDLEQQALQPLDPLSGLPLGLDYCTTQGVLELDDHRFFFSSEMIPLPAAIAQVLGLPAGQPVRYYPRRGFDLWGACYFLLPTVPLEWDSEMRGFASFLDDTDLIHPEAGDATWGKPLPGRGTEPWTVRDDWQLRRNRAAYPRAWLVHYARVRPPATSLGNTSESLMHAAAIRWC